MSRPSILIFLTLLCFGCNNDSVIGIPDDLKIDLNQDGIVDFEIIYEQSSVVAPVDPDPGPYEQIVGKLVSLNNNRILRNDELYSIIYLNDTNLIQTNTNPPYYWEEITDKSFSVIVSISQGINDKTWPEEWRINNDEIKNSYLIGFKLSDNVNSLGYFELSIDIQRGEIDILNIEFN